MRRILAGVVLCPFLAYAVPFSRRDLVGLFDTGSDLDQQPNPDSDSPPELILSPVIDISKTSTSLRTKATARKSYDGTSTVTWPTIIQPALESSTTALATTPESTWTVVPAPGPTTIVPEGPITSAEETTQWKVIGIGIITVGLIATVILSIIFFDSWWNFVCDLVCGRRGKNQGQEDMVPDWETRDWELKLANEDGHRYPTMLSLADNADKLAPL